jgi:transcriptional regulator with XRE-family HTH domain
LKGTPLTVQELFISNLKGYRKQQKISQMQLAEKCNSSTGYIGEIESDKRFPSIAMIEKIAEALNIESYYLFKNEPIGPIKAEPDLKLAPSQKKEIMDKVNSAVSKALSFY